MPPADSESGGKLEPQAAWLAPCGQLGSGCHALGYLKIFLAERGCLGVRLPLALGESDRLHLGG